VPHSLALVVRGVEHALAVEASEARRTAFASTSGRLPAASPCQIKVSGSQGEIERADTDLGGTGLGLAILHPAIRRCDRRRRFATAGPELWPIAQIAPAHFALPVYRKFLASGHATTFAFMHQTSGRAAGRTTAHSSCGVPSVKKKWNWRTPPASLAPRTEQRWQSDASIAVAWFRDAALRLSLTRLRDRARGMNPLSDGRFTWSQGLVLRHELF
jgi:hypothetical protein